MTSTRNPLEDFVLTPQQQNLLFAALNSNKPSNKQTSSILNMSPLQFDGSPNQHTDGLASFQGSPEFDYDYDFNGPDSSLDFFDAGNQPKMIGDLPGAPRSSKSDSPDNESPEKRSHPDDGEENTGAKRRESEDKVAKKPGRKPLTTEPTSRKAQNRAAQRAFRERKEKHLKDLENKVQELEKLSKTATSENEMLRAKIDAITAELNQYKKQVSMLSGSRLAHQGPARPFGHAFFKGMNDVNFQFEFPKFGSLPGQPVKNEPKQSSSGPSSSASAKRNSADQPSPTDNSRNGASPSNSSSYSQNGSDSQSKGDLADGSFGFTTPPQDTGNGPFGSSFSLDSHFNGGSARSASSPSVSSNSNVGGNSSSCGTSPESFTQSPMGFKPVDTLATIGEEQPGFDGLSQGIGHFGNTGFDDFAQWLPQSDYQFNPQLFGDYREPQESILSQGLDDSFFNDALDADFITPYNLPITGPTAPKKDLVAQIDAAKEADEADGDSKLLGYDKIWEKLSTCPRVATGEFDLDGLCADLQKKAKCSGGKQVVPEEDFNKAVKKYLCNDGDVPEACSATQS
ncbi:PAP1-domain-containing protein [Canariomyces notabilis]|uniref:PAP1-domain-containing protein n=1 Tax=Canariomyces notabilis TaxID=2074819 RepID=A0AAN6YRI4_9PEZI|nr:PAP1-domain-containing protein [Canariomyces arenarius]